MATPMSDKKPKAAKKAEIAAAKARAKQWHEEKNGGAKKSDGSGVKKYQSPKKKPPTKRTPSKAKKAATTTDDIPDVQYRKTPSRAERKKAREEASRKAAEWHNQRNKKVTKVPAVVDTEKNVEEDELSDVDDFKTAQARLSPSPRVNVALHQELNLLHNDIKCVLSRVAHLTETCSPPSSGAPMDCD